MKVQKINGRFYVLRNGVRYRLSSVEQAVQALLAEEADITEVQYLKAHGEGD